MDSTVEELLLQREKEQRSAGQRRRGLRLVVPSVLHEPNLTTGFSEHVARCVPQLRVLALRLTREKSDASDLVQETCLRALENRDKFVTGSAVDLKGWLCTIMRNLHLDRLRRRRWEVPSVHLDLLAVDSEPGFCQRWRLVDDQSVAEAVRGLPLHLQTPYVLFSYDRSTYATISSRLGIPKSTVATRIRRARVWLRRTLQVGPDVCEEAVRYAA